MSKLYILNYLTLNFLSIYTLSIWGLECLHGNVQLGPSVRIHLFLRDVCVIVNEGCLIIFFWQIEERLIPPNCERKKTH